MDRPDICLECQQPIHWVRRRNPRATVEPAWALFTGACSCLRRSHTTVKPAGEPRAAT